MGQSAKKEIIKEYGIYVDPVVQAYVREIGQKIVSVCERKNITYEFVVLDTELVNAFAVPGVVFITRGILQLIDDEAELACVLGHEVGHITGFHTVKMLQKAYGYQFLSTLSTVAIALYGPSVDDPRAYAVLNQATQLISTGFLRGFGREFELEADRSGLRYAVLAGYDPDAMTSFFKRMGSLGEEEVSGIGIFLRTHPPTNERIKEIKKILEAKYSALPSTGTVEDRFERYQEIMKELPALPSGKEGVIKDKEYFNPKFRVRLEVPRGWKLESILDEQTLVQFYSEDHKAQGELKTLKVGLGPVLQKIEEPHFAGVSQSTAPLSAKEWAINLEPSLRMEKRSGREVLYPVGPSYIGTYMGQNRLGRPTFFKILYWIKGGNSDGEQAFIISCWAPANSYFEYLVDFEKILKSFSIY